MPITFADRDEHVALGINSVFAVVPKNRPAFSHVIDQAEPLAVGFNRDEDTFKEGAFATARVRRFDPFIEATRAALNTATANARDIEQDRRTSLTPPPFVADAAERYGPEVRNRFRSLEGPGERHEFISTASTIVLAALLVEGGALANLTEQEAAMAQERALPAFHIARSGLSGAHPKRPSVDAIVVTGVDESAVMAQAQDVVRRFHERIATVEADEAAMQSLVSFIAAGLDVDPATALQRVLGTA